MLLAQFWIVVYRHRPCFLDDDLDHRRMQALGRVDRGRAALDVVDLGPFLDDDQACARTAPCFRR